MIGHDHTAGKPWSREMDPFLIAKPVLFTIMPMCVSKLPNGKKVLTGLQQVSLLRKQVWGTLHWLYYLPPTQRFSSVAGTSLARLLPEPPPGCSISQLCHNPTDLVLLQLGFLQR